METKRCSKCGEVKPISEFEFRKDTKRYRNHCRACVNKRVREAYQKSDERRKKKREYREVNREEILKKGRVYWASNKKELNQKQREYYYSNRELIIKRNKEYYKNHIEACRKRSSEYRKNNKKKINKLHREYYHNKEKFNPFHRLNKNIRYWIWFSLKNKKEDKHTEDILGYKIIPDLKKHIESQFQSGMSWDNYGEWHIDHKKPRSWFNFTSYKDKEFKECWALDNLQPKWAFDNRSKSNKYIG